MHNIMLLIIIVVIFGLFTLAIITVLLKFAKRDSMEHDIDYLWDHKYTPEDLNLERKN